MAGWFPEKLRWCFIEQGSKVLWAILRIGYYSIYIYIYIYIYKNLPLTTIVCLQERCSRLVQLVSETRTATAHIWLRDRRQQAHLCDGETAQWTRLPGLIRSLPGTGSWERSRHRPAQSGETFLCVNHGERSLSVLSKVQVFPFYSSLISDLTQKRTTDQVRVPPSSIWSTHSATFSISSTQIVLCIQENKLTVDLNNYTMPC